MENHTPDDVRNELLCFMQNKMNVMCFDEVVKITTDFYTESEVLEAKAVILKCVPTKRLTKRHGQEKVVKTVEDLLKILLDPTFNEILPHFFIRDLSRVPPVGTEHIDMSALLQEVAFLRSEVRHNAGISIIQEEVKNMKVMLDQLIATNLSLNNQLISEQNGDHVVVSPNDLSPLDELSLHMGPPSPTSAWNRHQPYDLLMYLCQGWSQPPLKRKSSIVRMKS